MDREMLRDVDYLALTLIGEARGEPIEGIIGVANVIRNRAYASQKSYKDVVLAHKQFSCWNEEDPNFSFLQKISNDLEQGNTIHDIYLRQCIIVARCVYEQDFRDNTMGAKNYVTSKRYQEARARQGPDDLWILKMKVSVILGTQMFLV